jgi:hypothetical protein
MAVHQKTNNIDKELTERLKSMTVEQLQGELQHNFKNGIHTKYNINKMSQDDVKNIKQQLTSLIIGKTHNNTNTLKCLDNKNNTIKNITNINRNRLLLNNNELMAQNTKTHTNSYSAKKNKRFIKYYNIFKERYLHQLSLNQTADSPSLDERFENYSRIINTIAGETIVSGRTRLIRYNNINNDFNNVVLDLNNNKGEEEDKLKYYAIKIIKKILEVKENILINPIFKNMSLIYSHGNITTNFFREGGKIK